MKNKVSVHKAPKGDSVDELKTNKGNWNVGKIFWGLLLVLVGGLALANNFGLIDVNFANLWRLWPLLIVAAGISILSLNNMAGRIVTIVLVVITLGAVTWVMVGNYPNLALHKYNTTIKKTSDAVKQAEININAGASSIQIGTISTDLVADVEFESNIASLSETSKLVGDSQQIALAMKSGENNGWMIGDVRNIWNIDLTTDLPLTLNIDAGASSSDIDMSGSKLKNMYIKTGASSAIIKLGDKEKITNINIESGVSNIVVKVPKSSVVQLLSDNGLTSNNLADLVNVGNNRYESPSYSQSAKQINIISKIGLSSFTIERY